MAKIGMLEAARPGRVRVGPGLRVLATLVLGGSAASAAALIYPAQSARVEIAHALPQPDGAPRAAQVPAKVEGRLGSLPPATAPAAPASAAGSVRQIPLISGVDPTPPTPSGMPAPQAAAVASPARSAAVQTTAPAPSVVASSAKAPVDCLPEGLRAVLQDVQARFGTVTVVSTRHLHTDNHTPGTARHKLHADCKAVDFKVEGDVNAVTAYLRARPEVSGINSYKNNRIIHMDATGGPKIAQR